MTGLIKRKSLRKRCGYVALSVPGMVPHAAPELPKPSAWSPPSPCFHSPFSLVQSILSTLMLAVLVRLLGQKYQILDRCESIDQ